MEQTWSRRFCLALAALTLFRLLYLALFPGDLSGDESYYWEWGRRLEWGYYSKPPLIAWLMALADWVGGGTVFGIRALATLFGAGSLAFVFLLGRRLAGAGAGVVAAAALALTPGSVVVNLVLTIDAPLLFFWSGALYASWRVLEGSRAWAIALIGLLGLGYLAKQMMLVFPLMGLLFLALDSEKRRWLRSPWLWAGWLASLAFLFPTLLWNADHHWVTFQQTGRHFEGSGGPYLDRLVDIGKFMGAQLGLVGPVLWPWIVGLAVSGFRGLEAWDPKRRFLWCFSAPGLLVVMLMSLRQFIRPNWPAVFYLAAILLLALAAPSGEARRRRLFRTGLVVNAALATMIYLLPLLMAITGLAGGRYDALERLRGWQAYGEQVGEAYGEANLPDDPFLITVGHHYHASELASYFPGRPRVYLWSGNPAAIETQYDLWPGPEERAGEDALIVVAPGRDLPESLRDRFDEVVTLIPLELTLRGEKRRIRLFAGRKFR
jgi:4-amino-4-deoxy-L-arabinose transferase-like glycosyltransferase